MEIVLQFSAQLHKVGSCLLTGGSLELLHNMENFSKSYRRSPRVSHCAEGHGCGCGHWIGVRRSSCHCHGGDLGKVPAHLCHTLLPHTHSKANATVMLHEEHGSVLLKSTCFQLGTDISWFFFALQGGRCFVRRLEDVLLESFFCLLPRCTVLLAF